MIAARVRCHSIVMAVGCMTLCDAAISENDSTEITALRTTTIQSNGPSWLWSICLGIDSDLAGIVLLQRLCLIT